MQSSFRKRISAILCCGAVAIACSLTSTVASAQYPYGLARPHYQPVALYAPPSAQIALAGPARFEAPQAAPLSAAFQIGAVYRFQITNIPGQPGVELYPTLEVIGSISPPPGRAAEFPIPVHISADDLVQALAGRLVTRVVYLEDPESALPLADAPRTQRSFDVRPDTDPLHEADRLGRPVAVLRIGSRVPPNDPGQLIQFLLGSPQWLPLLTSEPAENQPSAQPPTETQIQAFVRPAPESPVSTR